MDIKKHKYNKKNIYYTYKPNNEIVLRACYYLNAENNSNLVQEGKGRKVFKEEINGVNYFFKQYKHRSFDKKFKNLFRKSSAFRALNVSIKLQNNDIPVVTPILAFEEKKKYCVYNSVFVTKEFKGNQLQNVVIDEHSLKKKLIIKMANVWADLLLNNFVNGDPNLTNILVQKYKNRFEICLVDVDNIKQVIFLTWKRVLKNLIDLNAHSYVNLAKSKSDISLKDRKLFLKYFLFYYDKIEDINKLYKYIHKKTFDKLSEWDKEYLIDL